jgi:hypothetical protein
MVQLYSAFPNATGKYSILLDDTSHGVFDIQGSNTGSCSSKSLFSVHNLDDTQHNLRLTVEGPSSGDQTDVIFAGIRYVNIQP